MTETISYKLTDHNGRTHDDTQWGENVRHEATGKGMKACTDGVIHSYASPYLAALMNPIHANFSRPILWHFREEGEWYTNGLKRHGKAGTTLRRARLPHFTPRQRVAFSIYVAQAALAAQSVRIPVWEKWSTDYLAGKIVKSEAAAAAWTAAVAAGTAGAGAGPLWTYGRATARLATAAAWTAARARSSAGAAAVARSAAVAAVAVARAAAGINLDSLARKAYQFERGTK